MYLEEGTFQRYKDITDLYLKGGREQKGVKERFRVSAMEAQRKGRHFAWKGLGETSLGKSSHGFSSGP